MQNEILTLEEVPVLLKAYADDPNAKKLQDILLFTAGLSQVEGAEVINRLSDNNLRKVHGMTKSELKTEVTRLKKTADEASFFEGTQLKPIRVVDALKKSHDYLTTHVDKQLRIYENGVFFADNTAKTAREIIALLGDDVTDGNITGVLNLLKVETMSDVDRHTDWVNLKNGRLCLRSWELLEHKPSFKSIVQLPVEFNPDAECPEFNTWLEDVLPASDDQLLLLQMIGYSMLQDVRFGKIMVLYGPTQTGKSTCLEVVKAFLGHDNVSAVSLHALDNEDRRFSRSGLVGKLANLSADLSSKYLAGDSQIKQIATGDPMQIEFKGMQGFSYTPFATLWASANQLPVSHDRTDAWYERLNILPFMNQHKGEAADRKILERLTQPTELSGILNRVLEVLPSLIQAGIFKETTSTREMLEQYRKENDHVSRFLSENYELNAETHVLEDDVYKTYQNWCEDEGIKPLSKTKFREGVKAWGVSRKRAGTDPNRHFFFSGMRLI